MSHAMNVLPLNDPYIGSIEWGGWVWTDDDVFRDPVTIGYFLSNDISTWFPIERDAVAAALQSWANVANMTFFLTENAASADLIEHNVPDFFFPDTGTFGEHGTTEDAAQPTSQFDGTILLGGNSYAHGYFNYQGFGWDESSSTGGLNVGGEGYWTLVHELGHGLGLAHPHDDGGGSTIFPGVTGTWVTGDNGLNQGIWTAMSYIATDDPTSAHTNHTGTDRWSDGGVEVANYGYLVGPMAFDIAAIQDLYGANTNFHGSGDTYTLPDQNALGTYWTCIWDTGGTDSISYSGNRDVTISLVAATLDDSPTGGGVISSANGIHGGYTIANGVVIENAYGGNGTDSLTGNSVANILDGGAGADTMTGGGGNDTYYVDTYGDFVVENAGGGSDQILCYLTNYTLGANIETLNYIGNPSADFTGYGNAADNTIIGWSGNDYLDGAGGADTMRGLSGNDAYTVDNVGDVVEENANQGTDRVRCYLTSYTLGANVEDLNYLGTPTADFTGIGNSLSNYILGWNGSDYLDGAAGADTLQGLGGNDAYTVDNVGDVVLESANQGTDRVRCYLTTYTLGANVENVNYLGTPTLDFTGIGNSLSNYIIGWNGNDYLDGGAGADTFEGFAGNDTFIIDNAGDAIIENSNNGTDIVVTSLTNYTLAANVENLTYSGASSFSGIGNGLDNNIAGSAVNDVLAGAGGNDTLQGGLGADNMAGGAGNDNYFVDNGGDAVIENVNEGSDTVYAALSYTLTANVETLVLQGAADLQGYGNTLANTLIGNSGNNLLDGGAGADGMLGGAGNDVYFVDNAGDGVVENANEGNDSVFASASFTLGVNVENLILQGSADLQGYGNGGANVLNGNTGNNLLNGGGGADLMVGGAGNDIYFADGPSDAAFEVANQGNDTVFATSSYGLAADVESLILQGSADLQAYGNNQANTIYGNSGSNLINAGGGIDLMAGGAGNDVYYVDDPSDACFEVAGQGNDAVFATCSYGLAADVETLILQGSANLQAYGSSQANTIYGNSGSNLINGGAGADLMAGGAGNDVYFVDNAGDGIIENASEGNDSVFASVSFALGANIEGLVLQGGANINGTGNSLANVISGGSGNNILDGASGADQLTGGLGNDTFVFRVGQANGDVVVDFAGNGASAGDALQFVGYGGGATFTTINATHWQVNYNGGTSHDIITFSNGAPIDPADYTFI